MTFHSEPLTPFSQPFTATFSNRLDATVSGEDPLNELREERSTLIHLELEGAGHDGPCGGEEKERCGETEEEQSTFAAPAWVVAVSERGCELFEGVAERGSQRFHRDGAPVGEIAEQETGRGVVGQHAIEEFVQRIDQHDLLGFAVGRFGPRSEICEPIRGAAQHRSIQLPFAAEVIGHRARVRPGLVADVSHAGAPISGVRKEPGRRLEQSFTRGEIHTVVCINFGQFLQAGVTSPSKEAVRRRSMSPKWGENRIRNLFKIIE